MAWASSDTTVANKQLIYYGGYPNGHKTDRYTGRQLGCATIPRDRYIGDSSPAGTLTTPTMTVASNVTELHVNAAVRGAMIVRVLDSDGAPTGLEATVGPGDSLDRKVNLPLGGLAGQSVRLQFELSDATLYAFYLR